MLLISLNQSHGREGPIKNMVFHQMVILLGITTQPANEWKDITVSYKNILKTVTQGRQQSINNQQFMLEKNESNI